MRQLEQDYIENLEPVRTRPVGPGGAGRGRIVVACRPLGGPLWPCRGIQTNTEFPAMSRMSLMAARAINEAARPGDGEISGRASPQRTQEGESHG
jgi:hypothetical protein